MNAQLTRFSLRCWASCWIAIHMWFIAVWRRVRIHQLMDPKWRQWHDLVHSIDLDRKYTLPSNRRHLSCEDCLQDNREDYQNYSVLCCVPFSHWTSGSTRLGGRQKFGIKLTVRQRSTLEFANKERRDCVQQLYTVKSTHIWAVLRRLRLLT